jgi:hypothetical protein
VAVAAAGAGALVLSSSCTAAAGSQRQQVQATRLPDVRPTDPSIWSNITGVVAGLNYVPT